MTQQGKLAYGQVILHILKFTSTHNIDMTYIYLFKLQKTYSN